MSWHCITAVVGGTAHGGPLLNADWEIPTFATDFASSDKFRFELILLDCHRGQIIGPTLLQPKFQLEPLDVHFSWESEGNPVDFQAAKGICAGARDLWVFPPNSTQISPCFQRLPGRGQRNHR